MFPLAVRRAHPRSRRRTVSYIRLQAPFPRFLLGNRRLRPRVAASASAAWWLTNLERKDEYTSVHRLNVHVPAVAFAHPVDLALMSERDGWKRWLVAEAVDPAACGSDLAEVVLSESAS